MSLCKRGKTWWISFTTPSGERVRCSAATEDKTQAQEFHDKLKAESWRVVKLGDKPKRTWDEAAYKWLMETQDKKTHHDDVAKINWLQQFFRGKYLDELTRDVIAIASLPEAENGAFFAIEPAAFDRIQLDEAKR